jgi:hypothetical protein
VRDLQDPVKRMEIFDEMRSSDEAINTAISAREQMIGSSNWLLSSPTTLRSAKRSSNSARTISTRAAGAAAPPLRRHSVRLRRVRESLRVRRSPVRANIVRGKIRRATKSIGRRIYLRKLAHIRQRTIYSFIVPPTGDLEFLRQYVYSGTARSPSSRPTSRREGSALDVQPARRRLLGLSADPELLPRLEVQAAAREAEPLRCRSIRCRHSDRRGRRRLDGARSQAPAPVPHGMASGQNTFLAHPFGGKISIASAEGQRDRQRARVGQVLQRRNREELPDASLELGTTDTGSRAVGETFSEQLQGVVQSDCEDIANIINEQLIIDLVDWNFGPQDAYPVFSPRPESRSIPRPRS